MVLVMIRCFVAVIVKVDPEIHVSSFNTFKDVSNPVIDDYRDTDTEDTVKVLTRSGR